MFAARNSGRPAFFRKCAHPDDRVGAPNNTFEPCHQAIPQRSAGHKVFRRTAAISQTAFRIDHDRSV